MRAPLRFFVVCYGLFFGLHFLVLTFLNQPLEQALFFEIHLSVFLVTFLLLLGLLKAFRRHSHTVAWLYLLGSGLKFGAFMLFLWPLFHADGEVSILEKTSFLIPYCCSLFLETRILISRLNKI